MRRLVVVLATWCVLIDGAELPASQGTSTSASARAFEVASIRRNTSDDARGFSSPGLVTPSGKATPRPGRISIGNIALRDVIAMAYDIQRNLIPHTLIGGPARIMEARFDIEAKPPDGAPASETLPMLRTLLADRFKLRTHTEKRDIPVYALVFARDGRLGPKLQPSDIDCAAPASATNSGRSLPSAERLRLCPPNIYGYDTPGPGDLTMTYRSSLDHMLMRIQPFVERPLVNATGLTGSFAWSISFAIRADSTTAPLVDAAFREQLGIRLDRRTAPFDVQVVDSVEMPTPN